MEFCPCNAFVNRICHMYDKTYYVTGLDIISDISYKQICIGFGVNFWNVCVVSHVFSFKTKSHN